MDCRRCDDSESGDGPSRRGFLLCAGAAVGVAIFGFDPSDPTALPVSFGASAAAAGSERRYPIPAADGVTIDRKEQVILVRFHGQAYAFNLACPHENTALKWLPKDGRFQCPKHESQYQPTGVFTSGRATRNMDRLGIRLEDNMLVVDLNKFYKSDKNAEAWAAATVPLT
jgi:Rieske Fe-S protein